MSCNTYALGSRRAALILDWSSSTLLASLADVALLAVHAVVQNLLLGLHASQPRAVTPASSTRRRSLNFLVFEALGPGSATIFFGDGTGSAESESC